MAKNNTDPHRVERRSVPYKTHVPKTPPRHPPGDEPRMSDARRRELASKKRLTRDEARDLFAELARIKRKDSWLIETSPQDKSDRAHSASASFTIVMPRVQELAELYAAYTDKQSKRASGQRGRVGDHGIFLATIIERLALRKDALDDWIPASELWNDFLGELDVLHLDPREHVAQSDHHKTYVEYKFSNALGMKRMTFGSFANTVSNARQAAQKSR